MLQLDWNAAIESIRETLPQTQFQNWFSPLRLIRFDEKSVVLGVPSRFHGEWVRQNYTRHLKCAIQQQCGTDVQLEFEISVRDENIEASLSRPQSTASVASSTSSVLRPQLRVVSSAVPKAEAAVLKKTEAQPEEDLSLSKEEVRLPNFPHPFHVLSYNRVAYDCSNLLLEEMAHLNSLFITGPIGMGKTHLLVDFAARYAQKYPNARIRFTSAESFTQEMVTALKTDSIYRFKQKYRQETDLLLFDDFSTMAKKLRSQEELLYIFNEISNRGGKVLFASSVGVQALEEFIEPLKSRLYSAVVVELLQMTSDDKFKLIFHLANHHRIPTDPFLFKDLSEKHHRDIRELQGTLLRLHLQSKLEGRKLDSDYMSRQGWVVEAQKPKVSLQDIILMVEHNFGVPQTELKSKSRKNVVTWARQVAMYLARLYTLLPLEEIGKAFGRDHATVIHAFQKVTETISSQPSKKYQVEYLKMKLQPKGPADNEPNLFS